MNTKHNSMRPKTRPAFHLAEPLGPMVTRMYRRSRPEGRTAGVAAMSPSPSIPSLPRLREAPTHSINFRRVLSPARRLQTRKTATLRSHMEVGNGQRSVRLPDNDHIVGGPNLGVHFINHHHAQPWRRVSVLGGVSPLRPRAHNMNDEFDILVKVFLRGARNGRCCSAGSPPAGASGCTGEKLALCQL